MRTVVGSVIGLLVTTGWLSAADAVDYVKDVQPILAKNCYSCHGNGKAKGRLRVDTMASLLKGGDSGPAVVPGKSKDSTLVQSLTGDNDIKRMPPKRSLTKAEIDTLKQWVDAGAKAPKDQPGAAANNPPGRKPGFGRRGRMREREREQERRREDSKKKDDDERKEDGDKQKEDNRKGDRKKNDRDDD